LRNDPDNDATPVACLQIYEEIFQIAKKRKV
jgi:hypothetical protein